MTHTRFNQICSIGVFSVAFSGALGCMSLASVPSELIQPTQESTRRVIEPKTVLAYGADRLPSSTASDWVSHADYVVDVRLTSEDRVGPSSEEVERGEGLVLRRVNFEVTDVLWASSAAPVAAPENFAWTTLGWKFSDGDLSKLTPMTGAHEPRFEVDGRYVMAIERPAPGCDDSGMMWRGLGSGALLPIEGGTVGAGELEGAPVTPAEAEQVWQDSDAILAQNFAGQNITELEERLIGVTPDTPAPRATSVSSSCASGENKLF